MLKSVLVSLIVALLLSIAPVCAKIESAYLVEKEGRTYAVTELLEHKRDKINPLNILRLRRGAEYYLFSVADSSYPVRLDAHFVKPAQIRGILDRRTFDERHPNYDMAIKFAQLGASVWSNL